MPTINGITTDENGIVTAIDKTKVVRVYTGRCGCMCGCLGNYHYSSAHFEVYRNYPDEHVSDRSVTIMVNKLVKSGMARVQDGYIVYYEDRDSDRNWVAYLTPDRPVKA